MHGKKGFSLVEMIVVIGIVAALASISIPLATNMSSKAKATETKMRMLELTSAIEAYNNDQGQLPFVGSNYPAGDQELSDANVVAILDILLGKGADSKKKYLSMPDAKKGRNGIVFDDKDKSKVAGITDAWGNKFYIKVDYDLDGKLTQTYTKDTDNKVDNELLVIISGGANQEAEGNDDIYSWK